MGKLLFLTQILQIVGAQTEIHFMNKNRAQLSCKSVFLIPKSVSCIVKVLELLGSSGYWELIFSIFSQIVVQ